MRHRPPARRHPRHADPAGGGRHGAPRAERRGHPDPDHLGRGTRPGGPPGPPGAPGAPLALARCWLPPPRCCCSGFRNRRPQKNPPSRPRRHR
ncbi:hypothetical protein NKH77_09530 [Streptomyces sp. M19]